MPIKPLPSVLSIGTTEGPRLVRLTRHGLPPTRDLYNGHPLFQIAGSVRRFQERASSECSAPRVEGSTRPRHGATDVSCAESSVGVACGSHHNTAAHR